MSRYRPPRPSGSKYITPEGYKRLQDELTYLWKVERPQVTAAVAEAAAQGDRSENAEYTYGKKRLREIDRRIRYLSKRLDGMIVVDQLPSDQSRIYFGAWFELEDEQGNLHRYRIVGPDEFDPAKGWISMDSPLGRAVLRKQVDDEVRVRLPSGEVTYVVTEIRYRSFDED
ncbi:MAG: transcription elongation factor GreB [Xanthomonadaceae bacterium]|mgnify:FL=1|nr:transcription elongation factor GreB [Xanthomonadaceae bacterium]